jgi:hypothetical protein
MKTIARIALLFLVVAGLALWGWDRFGAGSGFGEETTAASPHPDAPAPAGETHVVVVTYFTTDVRCASCLRIEALTGETVAKHFAEDVAAGRVVYQSINIDRRENRHFIGNYQLSFKTVVVSDRWGNRERSWRKMDDVWNLLREPEVFHEYLANEIATKLAAET